jgi:hypothetical protein
MKIECLLKREEPIEVQISGETYRFEPDDKGRRVAEVLIEDHINAFLSVSTLYRALPPDDEGVPAPTVPKEEPESLDDLREEYRKATGKKPFFGWGAEELKARIEAAR